MKALIQSAILTAPSEFGSCNYELEKLRRKKPPEWARKTASAKADWQFRNREEIARELKTAEFERITITDGRTSFTVWNTKENLEALLKRVKTCNSFLA